MLNKAGKVSLVLGIALLAISPVFDILLLSILLSIFLISAGLCLMYLESDLRKRKQVTLVVFIIALVLFISGWYFKKMHWLGANVVLTSSLFLFSFTVLPLFTKSRYQTRNLSISTTVLLLSMADLSALIAISLGVISRLLHWPFSEALPVGIAMLVASMICWNLSFRKEVKRRVEAEEQLKNTLAQLEEKQQEILSSIRYARRIQQAHLPSHFSLSKTLNRLKGGD